MNPKPAAFHARMLKFAVAFAAAAGVARVEAQLLAPPVLPAAPTVWPEEGGVDVRLRLGGPEREGPERAGERASRAPAVKPAGVMPAAPQTSASAPRLEPEPRARAARESLPVTYCFGPLFGNNEREPDPNYLPPPVASGAAGRGDAPAIDQAYYTRVPAGESGLTRWVGSNGSEIRYLSRSWLGENGPRADGEARKQAARASVGEIISENRRELVSLSWARAHRRHPELDGEERAAFEAYLLARRATPSDAEAFARPTWPEALAEDYLAERARRRAEEAAARRDEATAVGARID